MTLEPGDVIFTGTPGSTQTMHPGEVIEIELEGVGVLRNRGCGVEFKRISYCCLWASNLRFHQVQSERVSFGSKSFKFRLV